MEHTLWVTDENLGLTELPLTGLDASKTFKDGASTLTWVALPFTPRTPGGLVELLVTTQETVEWCTIGETGTTHLNVLEKTKILALMAHTLVIPDARLLHIVGLDATDVVRSALSKGGHQSVGRGLDLETSSSWPLALTAASGFFLRSDGEEVVDEGSGAGTHAVDTLLEQSILVLIGETFAFVSHLTGVVLDGKGTSESTPVLMAREETISLLEELLISGGTTLSVDGGADIIEKREKTRGVLTLDKIAHDLVVEELDGCPLDTFCDVLFLLFLEGLLNEVLLKLLINVVDAELLETVVVKDLETEDIKNADNASVRKLPFVECKIDLVDEVSEKTVVKITGKGITGTLSLGEVKRRLENLLTTADTASHLTEQHAVLEILGVDPPEAGSDVELGLIGNVSITTAILLEDDVAKVENTGDDLKDVVLLGGVDTHSVHGADDLLEVFCIIDIIDSVATALVDVVEVLHTVELELVDETLIGTEDELIEEVEVTLTGLLTDHTTLLEQVVGDTPTNRITLCIKVNLEILTETGGVVITDGLGITESLQKRVRVKDNALDELYLLAVTRHGSDVLHDLLSSHSLTSTRLTRDDSTLVGFLLLHCTIGFLSKCKDVRRQFVTELALVETNVLIGGQTEILVGVNNDQHRADVGVDGIIRVTLLKVFHDISFSDLGKHNQIIDTLLCETTLALEFCNFFCRIPLPSLKACTHLPSKKKLYRKERLNK